MKVIAADSRQIEARINAWLAEHETLVESFSDSSRDVYAEFGTRVFAREVTKEKTPDERQCAKALLLGAGYQMGFMKLAGEMLKGMFGAPPRQFTQVDVENLGVDVEQFMSREDKMSRVASMPSRLPLAERIVHCAVAEKLIWMYRDANKPIVELWSMMDEVIAAMHEGTEVVFGPNDCLRTVRHGIVLPNDMVLRYPGLRESEDDGYSYLGGRGGKERVKCYGGSMTENICQSLARIVISDQMLMVYGKYGLRPATCTHDELVYIVEDDKAEDALEKVKAEMCMPPEWAAGLPLDASGGIGPTYGEAK